jgi:isopenicillin-N epimerase
VDGAHALGQIPLDLQDVGADFYTGNGHKWLCSPKGSAFLYTRPEKQLLIEPLVVGWGWGEERAYTFGSDYLDYLQWLGTNDLASYLAVPAAIKFQADHEWPAVRRRCHDLLRSAIRDICEMTGLTSLYANDVDYYHQMAVAPLPIQNDLPALKARLYEEFSIEIPLIEWEDLHLVRISVQGYNSQEDIQALLDALEAVL